MKLALTLYASVFGMEDGTGHGKQDADNIHIGGGAFDAGTHDALALWAIRKCKKKVCAVWPWAKCPLTDIGDMSKENKKTRGPCCHKCWNKCPPYLARHKAGDKNVFGNSEKRRYLKDEVWKFLQNDIECETSRLKDEFTYNAEEQGHSMSELSEYVNMHDSTIDGFSSEGGMLIFSPDTDGTIMLHDAKETAKPDPACSERFGWYQCHGSKVGHCCSNGCLNNPDRLTGKCGLCECAGKCDYLDRMIWTKSEERRMNCHLLEPTEALELA